MLGKPTVLRFLLLATLLILAIEYSLGIYVNAYLAPPYGDAVFSAHYALGVLLGALAVLVLAFSALTRSVPAIATSAVALVFIASAGQSGRLFAFQGQDPVYSVVMALGFLIAFASYFSEVLVVRRMSMMIVAQQAKTAGLVAQQQKT